MITSGRGKVLIYQGFSYQQNKERGNRIYWRSTTAGCRAALHTNTFVVQNPAANIIVHYVAIHSHLPNNQMVEKKEVVHEMKNRIQQNPTLPVKRVYDQVVAQQQQQPQGARAGNIPQFNQVSSSLNRKRSVDLPSVPHNMAAVAVQGDWARTWANELYLSYINNMESIVVFATDEDCRLLLRCDVMYVDGTFRSSPHASVCPVLHYPWPA